MSGLENLKRGYDEYLDGAKLLESEGNYKSAVNLYFKALTSLVDYILKKEINELPRNHTERFRLTEKNFNKIYLVLDLLFSTYRDSYTKEREEKHVKRIKDGIRKIIKNQEIGKEFEIPD